MLLAVREVAVVTPWYPTRELPYRGAFVRAMVEATAPGCDRATLYHCDSWVARMSPGLEESVDRAQAELLPVASRTRPTAGGAGLVYLPVPVPRGLAYGELARRHEAALRTALGGGPFPEPVIHAHVGLPSGWAAVRNARPDARVFVTEHASFLERILAEPDGRARYDELLHRCTGLFAVGAGLRDALVRVFPHHADRIRIVPNPISFDLPRPEPVTELRRWLFVGALIPLKGVDWLLEAFGKCHADDPRLTLTLVGDGELAGSLRQRAAALGIVDAVRFTGGVPPDRALLLMREHDLLVHPSRQETFGMAIVEAVAAGLPVLVTRCGGPERSLAGIEDAAGVMIDVEDSDTGIVAGYHQLRARFPDRLDLPQARRVLEGRYGFRAVAAVHHRAWFAGEFGDREG